MLDNAKKEDLRTINVAVSKECWKKLKIMSVQKEMSLLQIARDILEKYTSSKKGNVVDLQALDEVV